MGPRGCAHLRRRVRNPAGGGRFGAAPWRWRCTSGEATGTGQMDSAGRGEARVDDDLGRRPTDGAANRSTGGAAALLGPDEDGGAPAADWPAAGLRDGAAALVEGLDSSDEGHSKLGEEVSGGARLPSSSRRSGGARLRWGKRRAVGRDRGSERRGASRAAGKSRVWG